MTVHERLAQLERAQLSNNEQFTILLGVAHDQGVDIKAMRVDISDMRVDINEMRQDMHSIAATLEAHTTILQQILEKLPGKE